MPEPPSSPAEPNPPTPNGKPRRFATLARRSGSATTLWALVLAAVILQNSLLGFACIALIAFRAIWEYFKFVPGPLGWSYQLFGYLLGATYLGGSFVSFYFRGNLDSSAIDSAAVVAALLGVFLPPIYAKSLEGKKTLADMGFTLLGFFYVFFLFNYVTKLLFLPPGSGGMTISGSLFVLYLIVVTKFSDMGAYVIGSWLGRNKMIRHVSPAKTWEGLGGAVLFSLLGSFLLVLIFPKQLAPITLLHAGILGVVLSLTAVMGDLAESVLKRSVDVKDSGDVFPGIGGVLDLIDSILFTAPILYLYLKYMFPASAWPAP